MFTKYVNYNCISMSVTEMIRYIATLQTRYYATHCESDGTTCCHIYVPEDIGILSVPTQRLSKVNYLSTFNNLSFTAGIMGIHYA